LEFESSQDSMQSSNSDSQSWISLYQNVPVLLPNYICPLQEDLDHEAFSFLRLKGALSFSIN